MATSGTVSTTVFTTRKVIDHAFRRCDMVPQQVAQEELDTALDLLFLNLSELGNKGIPLWTVKSILLPIYERVPSVPTPLGTMDILNANLRTPQRATGTDTSSEGVAGNAFDGDLSTACVQTLAGGNIQTEFASAVAIPIYGINFNATGSWDFDVEYSDDGITWTNIFSETGYAAVAGEWYWRDVEGVETHLYYRLLATGTTVLNVSELYWGHTPREIPMYKLNRDDYSNLPDKTRPGRPTQFWYDKTRTRPVITLWPSPQLQFTFSQITGYRHRQIEDVGTMQQEIECPQRWYKAIMLGLAKELVREVKEANKNLIPVIDQDELMARNSAWDGETDGSDAYFRPNIRPYTA